MSKQLYVDPITGILHELDEVQEEIEESAECLEENLNTLVNPTYSEDFEWPVTPVVAPAPRIIVVGRKRPAIRTLTPKRVVDVSFRV
jgi:hypothetical protein